MPGLKPGATFKSTAKNSTGLDSGAVEFFADDAAEGGFEGFVGAADVLAQGFVDQRLVVAAAGFVDLMTEPVENIVIEPDGDPGFPLGNREHRAALAFAEIVFTLHWFPHIGAVHAVSPGEPR